MGTGGAHFSKSKIPFAIYLYSVHAMFLDVDARIDIGSVLLLRGFAVAAQGMKRQKQQQVT